ncbi:alkene reductase [Chryseolinea lacunae]|uniref:Alkene reductase n=1 Tax=Chryseolinea lacunae TaxID=2801331 RepID=A0ABS1KQT8_9BACT|nr:alkene reductase [Chryseolinea lacunae]MBL0741052.1 alkene reductase [Chryseolinea lacunae]
MSSSPLFQSISLGSLTLPNRIAMAPMTRGRSKNPGIVPTEMQALYYGQRASAGLIISEGTWISKEAIGFINVPGIFSEAQVEGWRAITEIVHQKEGRIFLQLGHAGLLSHPHHLDGELPLGPSSINPLTKSYTAQGVQDTVTPREMSLEDIQRTLSDYRNAAQNAKDAGFDGIELHVQHPSILSQFLSNALNKRTDQYGGTMENKTRFLLEVLDTVMTVWHSKRISVRITPNLSYSQPGETPDDSENTYRFVAQQLNKYDLAFLHIVDRPEPGISPEAQKDRKLFENFRKIYKGTIMANGGFTLEKANQLLEDGYADIISFGTLYISNPDLVERFRTNANLNDADPATFFVGDDNGYIDYPSLSLNEHYA